MRTVPLVVYKDGERKEIGEAFVSEDGAINGKITEEVDLAGVLKAGMVFGASLGPLPDLTGLTVEEARELGYNVKEQDG
jgi:hypothetical protein